MDRLELEQQIQSIRRLLQDTYARISDMHNQYIPTPDVSVRSAGNLINREQYDVVVCGEVKKGKSSFINALMGDNILPTNTQVATSQVFRIINSNTEEYHLVFTDGERQRISKEELSKYGSQVDADLYGEPVFRHHQLDYIEVRHPIPALPQSVALVDTPGIGALYAAHEQITRNYLSNASAVIFILDPKNPIVTKEREFIESALQQTKQIMFVMTKADNYDEGVIATMISRDEEILAPYARQTAMGRISIQPMSSTLLFDATKDKDDLLLEMSRFEEIKDTLLRMIYNTVGFGISATVYNAFNLYNTRVVQALQELHTSASSQQDVAKQLAAKKLAKQQEFAQEWGTNGAKLRDIQDRVKEQVRSLENEARALFSQNHPIFKSMSSEIENLSSSEDAERLSRSISSRLIDSYGKAWKDLMANCENQVEGVLIEYNAHLSDVDTDNSNFAVDTFRPKERTLADRLSAGRNSYFTGAFVTSLFAIPMAIVAAPLTAGIAALGLLLGIGSGIATKRDTELKRWKQNLKEHLLKCYSQIYDNFLVKTTHGKTQLQSAEEEIIEQSMSAVRRIYEQHKSNLDNQLRLLEEQAQADDAARRQKQQEIESVQKQWKPVFDNLTKARTLLTQMEQQRKSL